jgi:hypothetical protein
MWNGSSLTYSPISTFFFGGLSACISLILLPIAGLLLGFWVNESLPGHMRNATPGFVLQGTLFFVSLFLGGALWALVLSRRFGSSVKRIAILRGGLGYALIALGSGILLAVLERPLVEENALPALAIHDIFTLLFTPAAGLICGGSIFVIALAFIRPVAAISIAARCGVIAALVFLLTNRGLHLLGWQVGAPNAAERFTMLVVMMSGFLAVALVCGGIFALQLRPILGAQLTEAQLAASQPG